MPVLDFREAWDTIGNSCEVVETFSLNYNSLKQAMDAVCDYLGMQICENSGTPAESARTHTVLLSGVFLGGVQVFSIVNLRSDSNKNVGMRLTVRRTQSLVASVASPDSGSDLLARHCKNPPETSLQRSCPTTISFAPLASRRPYATAPRLAAQLVTLHTPRCDLPRCKSANSSPVLWLEF